MRITPITLLVLTAAAASLALATTQGPDHFGYSASNTATYSFINIAASGGTRILAGTDDGTAPLTLPFSFQFYGTGYTSLCVSTNGLISFGGCNSNFSNVDFTTSAPAGDQPTIAPLWTDLTFNKPGSDAIYYQVTGTAPNRQYVIQWNNAYGPSTASGLTFEVVLSETSNTILFQYLTVAVGVATMDNGKSATVGIRGTGGQSSGNVLQWSYGAPSLNNKLAIGFSTSGPSLLSIAVTPPNPTIAKTATQQFTATGTYTDTTTQDLTTQVTWASATTSVATITASGGLATAVSGGSSNISATLGAISGSTLLTVTVPVPNVVGLTQAAATTALTGAGLVVGTVSTASSGTVAAGSVISSTPSSGTQVHAGSAVNLVISTGLTQILVPNVVGLSQAAASTAITGAGLTVGTVTTASSPTVAAGNVISSTPSSGTSVNVGSAVNLVISTGPAQVQVPNVVGLSQAAASTAITGAGLTVGTVTTASSPTVAAGNVISSNPTGGTSVNVGSAVNLVISTGPAQVQVPNVVGLSQAAASTAITGAGLTVGTVTTASSLTVAAGNVISSTPSSGTSVNVGSAVNLVISTGPAQVPILIASSPSSLAFTVAGTGCSPGSYTTGQTLQWIQGSSCQVTFTSPVSLGTGIRAVFGSWNDANTSNPRTFSAPASAATYTATFQTQYLVTTQVSPAGAGTVSGGGYVNAAGAAILSPSALAGYSFANWSGYAGGPSTANPLNLTVNSPINVVANFTAAVPQLAALIASHSNTAGTETLTIGMQNTGTVAATNVVITSVVVTVVSGSGTLGAVSPPTRTLGTVGVGVTVNSLPFTLSIPATVTRIKVVVNYTAAGGYTGSTASTIFK